MQHQNIPLGGFLREKQILGSKKAGIPPIIPVSHSTWWKWVAEGRAPQPVRLGKRTTVWRVEDIRKMVEGAQ